VRDLPDLTLLAPAQITIYNKKIVDHTVTADGISGNLADSLISARVFCQPCVLAYWPFFANGSGLVGRSQERSSSAMCDFSLHNVKSRPAKVGDKRTTHNFITGTCGFAAPEDSTTAVCIFFPERSSPFPRR
jgi:hypothetical protein